MAVRGIANSQKEASSEILRGLLKVSDEYVVLAAARELANLGKRESLGALIRLMNSRDVEIRIAGHRVTRSLTNKDFKYYAFGKPKSRNAAIKRWKDWLANDGRKAGLYFPVVENEIPLGRLLISDTQQGKVIELDLDDGKVVWKKAVSNPWGVQGLSNGHRLTSLYRDSAIVEYDAAGNEVGKIEGIPGNAMGFCRLENGHTLVAGRDSGKIMEYDVKGVIVWQKEIGVRPTDIKKLKNGNVMVSMMSEGRIVEFDREGKRIMSIKVAAKPMSLQVTQRGTFITAHSGQKKAIEYDPKGKVIREFEAKTNVTGARKMANGDIIFSTTNAIRRQDRDGNIIWEYKGLTYCYNVAPY